MSELDKYFEKAKNVEPIYQEDDAKKLLYGKLSDGGIATNLYNKIKAFPMITTLITSVATIATIAIMSLSNPTNKVEQPNKGSSPALVEQTKEEPNEKPKDLNWTEDKLPTADNSIALLSEKEQETNKKPRDLNWTEEKIDIKSVNSLKLTKDELAKLGIEINGKNFKVNAFDKYTYTIKKNNEKQRDYYDKDEDRDALPTPAMVTTSTGFKTLTLFKKGNVEATVDRKRRKTYSVSDGKVIKSTNEEILTYENLDTSLSLTDDAYLKDLLLRESDDVNVIMLNSYETTEDGGKVNVLSDRNVKIYSTDLDLKDINTVLETSLDSLSNKNTTLIEVDATEEMSSNDPNNRTIHIPLKSLGVGKKIKLRNDDDNNTKIININTEDIKVERNGNSVYRSIDFTKFYDVSNKFKNAPEYDFKKGLEKYKLLLIGNVDSAEIIKWIQKPKSFQYDSEGESFVINSSKNTTETRNNDKLNSINYDYNINLNKDKKPQSLVIESFEYNINELIPIEISFDGVNTDFIVWYEATDDFLTKLPAKLLEKINPELLALTQQNDHCENEPIEKKDAVMDVWSGCSGAIKEMKVFPNPATSNSNVEFELVDNRVVSIAIFDLSGKLIKNVKSGMSLSKGSTNEPLNLSGVNPGMYYVVVKSDKGEQALQRIIIE